MKQIKNSKLKIQNLSKGFTLVELLIVIAIIGVLSALLMSNFIGVRQRARDAQRKSDLRQIQSALEIYRSDNGSYPLSDGSEYPSSCGDPISSSASTVYMAKVPCDPNGSSYLYNSGNYYYNSNGSTYTLGACLENANDNDTTNDTDTDPQGGNSCSSSKYYVLNNQ